MMTFDLQVIKCYALVPMTTVPRTQPDPAGSSAGFRSRCPIARSLDVIGDRWTLLVVRDLMFRDKHTYKAFQESREGIPTNILADRLKKLTAWGLVERRPYQDRPVRYEYHLTDRGLALRPVLESIVAWGNATLSEDEPTG